MPLVRSRLVDAQDFVFQGRPVEASDQSLEVFVGGGFDKGVALRLLCFEVAYDLDLVEEAQEAGKLLENLPALWGQA